MKKFILITIALLLSLSLLTYKFYKEDSIEEVPTKNIKQSSMLSMMLETEKGSGKYEVSTSNCWSTEGYVFNSELSKCENGSILSWDDTNKQVVFSGNITDKCYIYFDVYVEPRFDEICDSTTLACYVAKLYTEAQGKNNIYYHDSNLENGAEDNSYRYVGASVDVNNYICLGSSEETCPADNLYRIIGVFGEENHGIVGEQLVKVIKNTSYGNIARNTTRDNDWSGATLNQTLNTTFKTEKLSSIENKIAEVSWSVSEYNTSAATAKTVYTAEITNATKKHTAKIGLMYPSDYGFATTQDYWTTSLSGYDSAAKNKDWLYLGSAEWLLSPSTNNSYFAWLVTSSGYVGVNYVTNTYAVRPSFYLTSSVQYISGFGQESDPIRIN